MAKPRRRRGKPSGAAGRAAAGEAEAEAGDAAAGGFWRGQIAKIVGAVLALVTAIAVALINIVPEKAVCRFFDTCDDAKADAKGGTVSGGPEPGQSGKGNGGPASGSGPGLGLGGTDTTGGNSTPGGYGTTGGTSTPGGNGATGGKTPGVGGTPGGNHGTAGTTGTPHPTGNTGGTPTPSRTQDPHIAGLPDPGTHAASVKDLTWTRTMSVTVEDIGDYGDRHGELSVDPTALLADGATMIDIGVTAPTYSQCAYASPTLTRIEFRRMTPHHHLCVDNGQYLATFEIIRLPSDGNPYLRLAGKSWNLGDRPR